MKKVVYTSLDNFKLKHQEVKSYLELDGSMVEWIEENSIHLLISRNKAELKAGEELKKYISDVQEQVYFRIEGRSYFLDYYLPKYKIAIEIDGSFHKIRKTEDKERDEMFWGIGIRTIRIPAKEVLRGNFIRVLRERLKPKKKKSLLIRQHRFRFLPIAQRFFILTKMRAFISTILLQKAKRKQRLTAKLNPFFITTMISALSVI